MRRVTGLALVVALLTAACGDDSAGTTTTTRATATTTTAANTTTTAASAATTTATAPTTTTTTAATTTTTTTTTPATVSAIPSGSGCSPPGNTLPDGDWFGFIEGIDLNKGEVMFDLACHFDQAQADIAAANDGYPTPLEFYPYVRNQNPLVFVLTIDPNAVHEDWQGNVQPFADWVNSIPPDTGCSDTTNYDACALWIEVEGTTLTRVEDPLPEWSGDGRD